MEISTYSFSGDIITVIGFIGVLSTLLIVYTAFTRYFKNALRK